MYDINKDMLVSVIIPVYNAEKYLKRCLDSVCNQTYRNLEIILIDDGSPDQSLAICKERADGDKRIRVISKKNEGQGKARNVGLDLMKGEYAIFVDSDDYIHIDMIHSLLSVAQHFDSDMVQCLYTEVKEDEKLDNTYQLNLSDNSIRLEKMENRKLCYYTEDIIPVNKLIKKSLIAENRFPEGIFYEDKHLMFRLRHQAKKIVYVDLVLYYYVQSQNSTMRGVLDSKRIDSKLRVAEELLEYCKKNQLMEDYESELSGYFRMYLSIYFSTYKNSEFQEFNKIVREKIEKYLQKDVIAASV